MANEKIYGACLKISMDDVSCYKEIIIKHSGYIDKAS